MSLVGTVGLEPTVLPRCKRGAIATTQRANIEIRQDFLCVAHCGLFTANLLTANNKDHFITLVYLNTNC